MGSYITVWLSNHKYVLNWPKTASQYHLQNSIFRCVRGPTAVTLVINHLISIKWPWVKLLELKRRVLHHTVAPWPQNQLELAKKTLSQNHPQNSTFRSVRGSDSWWIGNQLLHFHLMTLGKVIRAQEEVAASQSGSPTANTVVKTLF